MPVKYGGMIIEINDSMHTGEISNAFAAGFPFLTIRFFEDPHGWGEPSVLQQRLEDDKTIAAIRTVHSPGVIEIHGWHKTGTVEQAFKSLFGLHVQVLRREGNAWVQTADTDTRTLDEQNEAGRNASQELLDGTDERFNHENPA